MATDRLNFWNLEMELLISQIRSRQPWLFNDDGDKEIQHRIAIPESDLSDSSGTKFGNQLQVLNDYLIENLNSEIDDSHEFMAELDKVKHVSSIKEYYDEFLRITNFLQLPEDGYMVYRFVFGLNEETRCYVNMFDPKTLNEAYYLATLHEFLNVHTSASLVDKIELLDENEREKIEKEKVTYKVFDEMSKSNFEMDNDKRQNVGCMFTTKLSSKEVKGIEFSLEVNDATRVTIDHYFELKLVQREMDSIVGTRMDIYEVDDESEFIERIVDKLPFKVHDVWKVIDVEVEVFEWKPGWLHWSKLLELYGDKILKRLVDLDLIKANKTPSTCVKKAGTDMKLLEKTNKQSQKCWEVVWSAYGLRGFYKGSVWDHNSGTTRSNENSSVYTARSNENNSCFKVNGIPHLVFLDENGEVLSDCGIEIIGEYGSEGYLFTPERVKEIRDQEKEAHKIQSLSSILESSSRDFIITVNGNTTLVTDLERKTVGLYFMLSTFKKSSDFTPTLVKIYNELKAKNENFEIVMISLNDEKESFNDELSGVPWFSIPFKDKKCEKLVRYFELSTLPTLFIIGPDGKTLHPNVVGAVEEYGTNAYPFAPDKFSELEKMEKAKLEAQTLESILVSGDLDFVVGKDGVKIPFWTDMGKGIFDPIVVVGQCCRGDFVLAHDPLICCSAVVCCCSELLIDPIVAEQKYQWLLFRYLPLLFRYSVQKHQWLLFCYLLLLFCYLVQEFNDVTKYKLLHKNKKWWDKTRKLTTDSVGRATRDFTLYGSNNSVSPFINCTLRSCKRKHQIEVWDIHKAQIQAKNKKVSLTVELISSSSDSYHTSNPYQVFLYHPWGQGCFREEGN